VTEPQPRSGGLPPTGSLYPYGQQSGANLADILERVLDKGIVIVGDIRVNLLDIELLTIKLRLLVASVDKAKEIGIDWWEHDPALSSRANRPDSADGLGGADTRHSLEEQNKRLRAEVRELRRRVAESPVSPASRAELPPRESGRPRRSRDPAEIRESPQPSGSREPRGAERESGERPRRARRRPVDDEDRDGEP